MLDLVASARAEITSGERSGDSGAALLRNLVEANMNQDGDSKKLTEGELLSNIFVSMQLIFALPCSAIPLLLGFPSCWTRLVDFTFCDAYNNLCPPAETSAHTLCFAFVLLALYPESQKRIYEEVTRLWPADVPVTQLATVSFVTHFHEQIANRIPTEPQRVHGQTC